MEFLASVRTINDLKNVSGESLEIPSNFKDELLKLDNSNEELSKKIIEWVNNICEDYNKTANNENRSYATDILLFNVIEVCLNFVPLYVKPYLLTNLCILADDEQNTELFKNHFVPYLEKTIELVNGIFDYKDKNAVQFIDDKICSNLGFLCFKTHKYDMAHKFLSKSVALLNKKIKPNCESEEIIYQYGASSIYLASCIEYMVSIKSFSNEYASTSYNDRKNELFEAIKQLIGRDEKAFKACIIKKKNKLKELSRISSSSYSFTNLKNLILELSGKNCFTVKIFDYLESDKTKELQNEYIHILAHCISEYAALIREIQSEEYPYCSLLQLISRFLLDWLVAHDYTKYVTCQATVRAENDATPEAINILLNQISSLDKDDIDSIAELEFYIFYLAEQELRWAYENDELQKVFCEHREAFCKYASQKAENEDYDALFHHHVIYFRYLLKQCIHKMVSKTDKNEADKKIGKIYDDLIEISQKTSNNVLYPIRKEFYRLDKLYGFYRIIKNVNSNKKDISASLSKEFEMLIHYYKKELEPHKDPNEVIKQIYKEITAPRNILLLAPIRNAPSCSFSIENIDELILFDATINDEKNLDFTESINSTIHELDNSSIEQTVKLYINENYGDNFKWAIYFSNDELFLYYKDFLPNRDYKMFPVVLNNQETNICKDLFNKLGENHVGGNLCEKRIGSCINSSFDVCYANSYDFKNRTIYNQLMDILVFIEFDFQKYNMHDHTFHSRINDDDTVIVTIRRKNEYSIAVFSKIAEVKKIPNLCKLCDFSRETGIPKKVTHGEKENEEHAVKKNKCKKINFALAYSSLSAIISDLSDQSAKYKEIRKQMDMISNCENSKSCPYESQEHLCVLYNCLYDYKIPGLYNGDDNSEKT